MDKSVFTRCYKDLLKSGDVDIFLQAFQTGNFVVRICQKRELIMNDYYLANVWREVVRIISEEGGFDESVLEMLAGNCYIVSLADAEVTMACTYFLAFVIIEQAKEQIKEAFFKVLHRHVEIKAFQEDTSKEEAKKDNVNVFFNTHCDKNYNFENFIVGKSNIQAQVSALTCATNPGLSYNPLFIYGNSGLGKTHLLNAIGNKVAALFPHYKIGLISGLDFVEGVTSSIKNHTINDFKTAFYNLDVLLVDDIQFIAGKEKTHEVFFRIFNELVDNKKQICVTSDRLPKDIEDLEERIISRFDQGLNVNIGAPEFETSLNILKSKLSLSSSQSIDEDVLTYIATNFSQDVRRLEGALNRLLFYAINFVPTNHITLEAAFEAFQGQVADADADIDINKIKKVVCDYYGITKQQLNSKVRTKKIAMPRQIAMYLCRKHLDIPYKDIGNNFGKRDHSTVINACERVEENMRNNDFYKKAIQELEANLK